MYNSNSNNFWKKEKAIEILQQNQKGEQKEQKTKEEDR